jgi:hypothetical protein
MRAVFRGSEYFDDQFPTADFTRQTVKNRRKHGYTCAFSPEIAHTPKSRPWGVMMMIAFIP